MRMTALHVFGIQSIRNLCTIFYKSLTEWRIESIGVDSYSNCFHVAVDTMSHEMKVLNSMGQNIDV